MKGEPSSFVFCLGFKPLATAPRIITCDIYEFK